MPVDDRVLYDGTSKRAGVRICVTTNWCVVNDTEYPIAELGNLGQSRGPRDPFHPSGMVGLIIVLGLLAAVIYAIRSGWTADFKAAAAAALVGTIGVTFLPAALVSVLRRPYEIWGEYEGSPVYLFGTYNREQFGQVSRALVRAQEAQEQ